MSDHVLYSVVNAKVCILLWLSHSNHYHSLIDIQGQECASLTCAGMHKRSERIASTILDRIEMKSSDHVALLYPPCVDLVSAFYACLYIGKIKPRIFDQGR